MTRGQGVVAVALLAVLCGLAVAGPVTGAADGTGAANGTADATVTSDTTRWQGQTLFFAAANESDAGAVYQVRRVVGAGQTEFVTEFVLDGDAEATIDTSGFSGGDYVVVDESRTPLAVGADGVATGPASLERASFELVAQTLSVGLTREAVVQENDTTLVVDSNRGRYGLVVSSQDLGVDGLSALFEGATPYDATGDGETDAVRLDATATMRRSLVVPASLSAGAYNLSFSVPDAAVAASVTLTVTEKPTVRASFSQVGYDGAIGEVIPVVVNVTNTDVATLTMDSSASAYEATVRVQDGDGDGSVTVEVNSYLAGRVPADEMDRVFSATGADRVVSAERSGGGEPLAVGGYNLAASVDGVTTDTATLILNEQSVRDVTTAVAPGSASLESVPRIVDATTERPRVAGGDQLVLRVEATGVSGVLDGAYDLDADGADAGTHGVALELAEANGSGVVDVSGATVVPDREADRYYVVFGPDAVSSLRPNTNYTARFLIDDRNPFVASGEELAVSTEFRIVERTATFDASEDEIRVEKPALDGEASVYGDSTVAPGTQLLVVMRGTGNSTLFQTDTVTVSRYGSWRARFDLEGVPEETTVTLKVRDGSAVVSDRVTGVVVENTLGKTVTDSGTTAAPSDGGGDSGPPWGQIGVVLVAVPILYGGWRYYEGRQDEGDVDAEE